MWKGDRMHTAVFLLAQKGGEKMGEVKDMRKLTPRQERFCLEYARTSNGAASYKNAYPAVKSDGAARACAARLLTQDNVQARLRELAAEIHSPKIMDAAEMQEWLTKIIRGEEPDSVMFPDGIERDKKTAQKDRLKAAELLGKMQGAFLNRQEIEVTGSVPVVIRDDMGGK